MKDIRELLKEAREAAHYADEYAGERELWTRVADALEAQAARIKELEAALKPFEKYQTEYPDEYSKHPIIGAFLNELRAASAALNGEKT
jgi:hypothetical protein